MEEVLLLVGHRTGGRAAEFLLKRLAVAVSDDTILRRIKRRARAAMHGEQRLRVVGVDDWAEKKGQTYGTILVDLERKNRSGPVAAALGRSVGGVAEATSGSGGHHARPVRTLCRRSSARRTAGATSCRPLSFVAGSSRGGRKRTRSTTSTIGLTASGRRPDVIAPLFFLPEDKPTLLGFFEPQQDQTYFGWQ